MIYYEEWIKRKKDFVEDEKMMIASPNYHLCPEYTVEEITEECLACLYWVKTHFPSLKKIIISGDSAGGNMSLILAHKIRDQNYDLISKEKLMLFPLYPVIKIPKEKRFQTTDSKLLFEKGLITNIRLFNLAEKYMSHHYDLLSNLKNLPQTLIICAEFDCLYDEAKQYYDLQKKEAEKEGTKCEYKLIKDELHGFFWNQEKSFKKSVDLMIEILKK